MKELGGLSWTEVEASMPERPVGILPVGSVEAHGPHLPLNTDLIIAQEMGRRAASALSRKGVLALPLPPVCYSVSEFGASFPGTIGIRRETSKAILWDVCRSLSETGFRAVLLANAHLEPAHRHVLREVAEEGSRELGLPIVFPDIVRRKFAERLTDEFRSGACHAGQFETSLVLAVRPDLVKDDVRAQLAPNWTSLAEKIGEGVGSFVEAGGPEAYFGDPAAATPEEGEETYETLAGLLVDELSRALTGSTR